MKIKADTTALEMSLMKAAGTIALRLKQMVTEFSYEFTVIAIGNTPLGDAETYVELYKARQAKYGLDPTEGFTQGSWQVDYDSNIQPQYLYSGSDAAKAVKINLMNYNLGQKVYIANTGPYIVALENGYSDQASDGIMKPTMEQVLSSYKIDLKRHYSKPL